MANDTTPYGRQQIEWPDLGSDPGVTLHGQVVAGITYLSNNITARWSGSLTLANTATVQITHHFGVALSALKIFVVESGAVLSESIQNASYTFTQVDTATVQVQNVSGVSKTFQVYIFPSKLNIRAADLDAAITVSTTGDVTAANIKATATLKTDDDNLELNSNAAGTGTDYKATIARGGSQSANATITLPSQTSTLATLTGAETLGSKTLVGAVISDYEDLNHVATPANPSAGKLRFYAKNDNKLYVKDSTGTEAVVGSGSGSGQKNYLSKYFAADAVVGTVSSTAAGGNITVAGSFPDVTSAWYADGTSGAAAIAVSSDNSLRGTANYLTALSGASTSGATFVQTPAFNIDGEDLGRALTVQFDLTGNTLDDDWDIVAVRYNSSGTFQELIPIAGNASSTTGTASAKLPTGTTQFNGFFITSTTASDVYSIRFRRRANAVNIRLDSLLVGPNQVLQGVIVTDWQTYTPALFNATGGTLTVNTAKARRNGGNLEIYGKFNFSVAPSVARIDFGLPDFFGTLATTETNVTVGFWSDLQGAENATYDYFQPCHITGGPAIGFKKLGVTNDDLRGDNVATGRVHSYYVTIPITGWSANTRMAARAVEEYAYNNSATATTDTTSFANGPEGFPIQAFAPTGTTTVQKKVRFQNVIQPTDTLILEVNNGTGWQSFSDALGAYVSDGTTAYGQIVRRSAGSLTDVGVFFASQTAGRSPWSGLSTFYWRVRKISGGAAVGYPVGARNVLGDATGTAVPTGYIGEKKSSLDLANTTLSVSGTTYNVGSVTLTTGVWIVYGHIGGVSPGGTTQTNLITSLSTTSATHEVTTTVRDLTSTISFDRYLAPAPLYINVTTATQVVYMTVSATYTGTAPVTTAAYSYLYGVRIA